MVNLTTETFCTDSLSFYLTAGVGWAERIEYDGFDSSSLSYQVASIREPEGSRFRGIIIFLCSLRITELTSPASIQS